MAGAACGSRAAMGPSGFGVTMASSWASAASAIGPCVEQRWAKIAAFSKKIGEYAKIAKKKSSYITDSKCIAPTYGYVIMRFSTPCR